MARTYIPGFTESVHRQALFLVRWNAILRPAIVAIDPAAGAAYDALYTAIIAMDALREVLDPLLP